MKLLRALLIVFAVLFALSFRYYSGITGKVVENATGKPIEGALVVAQWTNTRGIPGMQYHNLHKTVETLTDKEGKFSLRGTAGVLLNRPEMIIYKDGYIPWRNDFDFEEAKGNLSKNNEWKNKAIYKLDYFSNKYTSRQLYDFLDIGMTMGRGFSDSQKFTDLMHKMHR